MYRSEVPILAVGPFALVREAFETIDFRLKFEWEDHMEATSASSFDDLTIGVLPIWYGSSG